MFIDRVDLYAPGGGETRGVAQSGQRICLGSNPFTLAWLVLVTVPYYYERLEFRFDKYMLIHVAA